MTTPNFINIYPNALPDSMCDALVEMADELIESNHEGVDFQDSPDRVDHNIFMGQYTRFEPYVNEIKLSLAKYMKMYAKEYDFNYHDNYLVDAFKMQRSSEGQGFYTWHSEQGYGKSNCGRYAVWMFYLNDVTEGGATQFKHFNLNVQPTKGTLVLWPAAYTHMHRAAPDLRQNKYISTGWFAFPNE
jgi:hypothetical protein